MSDHDGLYVVLHLREHLLDLEASPPRYRVATMTPTA
jgi:hypothetical protein